MSQPHRCPWCWSGTYRYFNSDTGVLEPSKCFACSGTGIVWEPGGGLSQPIYTIAPEPIEAFGDDPQQFTTSGA